MQRTLAVIAAMGGCVLAGCNCAARLKRRYAVLSELREGIRRIQLGLTHTNRTVASLLSECGERETCALFAAMARDVTRGCAPMEAWENAERESASLIAGLTAGDRKTLTVFFSLLGGSDRYSQLQHTGATMQMLTMQCAEAKRAYEKNGRVYRTMGVLLGAGVAILLL